MKPTINKAPFLLLSLLISHYSSCMENGFNYLTTAISKVMRYGEKTLNQEGYVCNEDNQNKYRYVYTILQEHDAVNQAPNNVVFQGHTKQCNARTYAAQYFIKCILEGRKHPQIGALKEAIKNNYQAISPIFLYYALLVLKENNIVSEPQFQKFLKGQQLIFEAIQDIWPELKPQQIKLKINSEPTSKQTSTSTSTSTSKKKSKPSSQQNKDRQLPPPITGKNK